MWLLRARHTDIKVLSFRTWIPKLSHPWAQPPQ
uniref:Uncharacterized protein n=1 Tax=Anguilla anguilla TaxID=7936 RepID=A0A0E9RKQ2_ANGAN